MRLIDKVKLGLVALVVSLTLLCSINVMEGPLLPDQQQTQSFSQASESDDGVIKFVATNQNHLLRFEHSLRSDNQPKNVVYELIQSWSAQAILLVLLGWLAYSYVLRDVESILWNRTEAFKPGVEEMATPIGPARPVAISGRANTPQASLNFSIAIRTSFDEVSLYNFVYNETSEACLSCSRSRIPGDSIHNHLAAWAVTRTDFVFQEIERWIARRASS